MYKRQSRKRPLCPMQSAFFRIPFTYSICPRHPEYDGKSSSGRLLICSMGVSPSPLLCGPTANYGSIIVPCVCHCQHRLQFGFCRIGLIARSPKTGRGEAAKLSSFRVYTEAITAKLASTKSWRTYGRGYLRK